MSRQIQQRPTPSCYTQPDTSYRRDWTLQGTLENVDYIPETHLRIWYNNERGEYDVHHHSALEIILCLENNCEILADNKTYSLQPGEILMIPPHMMHSLTYKNFGVRFIFLIDIHILNGYHDFKTIGPMFMHPLYFTPVSSPKIYHYIYDSLMKIVDLYFENQAFWEIHIYSVFLELIATIGHNYFLENIAKETIIPVSKNLEYFHKFLGVLSFIDTNYANDLTLEQVAYYAGFSKFHFSRLFKTYTNTTFYNYLSHKRIQVAHSLLANPDLAIIDIATQTGFNNLTTFYRCFKKFTGCSPNEYKNKLLKNI